MSRCDFEQLRLLRVLVDAGTEYAVVCKIAMCEGLFMVCRYMCSLGCSKWRRALGSCKVGTRMGVVSVPFQTAAGRLEVFAASGTSARRCPPSRYAYVGQLNADVVLAQ